MRFGFVLSSLCLFIGLLPAQQTPLSGPVEGFTFDVPTRSVRPVIGSLGSASLGQPIVTGLAYASVAPHQNYALAFQGDRCVLIMGLGSSDQTLRVEVPQSFAAPEGISWSGDGSIAVLYSRTGNWVQILKGLPSKANPGSSLSLAPMQGTLSAVATDLHGDHIVIGTAGEVGGIYQITSGGSFVPLSTVAPTAVCLC